MTDSITTLRSFAKSRELHERAVRHLAGGVSTMVRADFRPTPLYVESAQGVHVHDVDGNDYIDYALAFGPLILGHGHPAILKAVSEQLPRGQTYGAQHELEVRVSEQIVGAIPGAEMVAFATTGSEATQLAARLARASTARRCIVRFEGHYHGWSDGLLYSYAAPVDRLGSRTAPQLIPGGEGQVLATDSLVSIPWNDTALIERLFEERGDEIAAVITEPIMFNSGGLVPLPGYLERVRELCTAHGALLIFDEVITGFRVAYGGAQQALGIQADLAVFGKAIAGGFPLSCVTGSERILSLIPDHRVVQAGTLNGNPIVLAAANAALSVLGSDAGRLYVEMGELADYLREGLVERIRAAGLRVVSAGRGAAFGLTFGLDTPPIDYREYATADRETAARFAEALLQEGVLTIQRGLWYLSAVHTPSDIELTLAAASRALERFAAT